MSEAHENTWPRQHFKGNLKNAAASLSKASKEFLLAHKRGENPAVPDSVWFGNDCWVLEHGQKGWRIGIFAREVMSQIEEPQATPSAQQGSEDA